MIFVLEDPPVLALFPSDFQATLEVVDLAFSIIFALECALRIVTFGPALYLSSGFNIIDLICVMTSIISLTGLGSDLTAFRLIRVLRPLRTINKFPELRNIV